MAKDLFFMLFVRIIIVTAFEINIFVEYKENKRPMKQIQTSSE
jgi:hypothetical protein